ncbi:MAG: DUF3617 domain-containing protein [Pseudomonadales bacterium]|jgi:hypothetical protein|nr:DUF3617 domain-containing protein [Pseudomonadales bacterium]
MRRLPLIFLALTGALAVSGVQALTLPAGKWALDLEVTSPDTPAPVQQHSEECYAEDLTLDPISILEQDGMNRFCEITPTTDNASEFIADIACDLGADTSGQGSLRMTLNGDQTTSDMQMTMNMGGHIVEFSSKSTGRRVGACE